MILLGVENSLAAIPSHSEPCMRLSPHTAPSLLSFVIGADAAGLTTIESCFLIVAVSV